MNKIIGQYKGDAKNLRNKSLKELSIIYQGKDAYTKDCLTSEVKDLFSEFKKIKTSELNEFIKSYNDAIDCFLNFNHAFFIQYSHETDKDEKDTAYSYIGSSQVHLTKLQSQYNQLVYRKQQKDNKRSMLIARISLYVGIVSLIVGTIISICGLTK